MSEMQTAEFQTAEIQTMPKSEGKGVQNSDSSDFRRLGLRNNTSTV